MNTLVIAVFAGLAVMAAAKPSSIWGHGHGHLPLVGASGVVSSGGAAGPAGVVNGHGAVGPNGIANAIGHAGVWGVGGHAGAWDGEDDGQWHGEGLLASQDWGHGHDGVVGAYGIGLGWGHGYGHGHW